MSDYPASLGDLADVEARLDAAITRLEMRAIQKSDETERELADLRNTLAAERAWSELATQTIARLELKVVELEKLWVVARANPDLVRELAVEALKGREAG